MWHTYLNIVFHKEFDGIFRQPQDGVCDRRLEWDIYILVQPESPLLIEEGHGIHFILISDQGNFAGCNFALRILCFFFVKTILL